MEVGPLFVRATRLYGVARGALGLEDFSTLGLQVGWCRLVGEEGEPGARHWTHGAEFESGVAEGAHLVPRAARRFFLLLLSLAQSSLFLPLPDWLGGVWGMRQRDGGISGDLRAMTWHEDYQATRWFV